MTLRAAGVLVGLRASLDGFASWREMLSQVRIEVTQIFKKNSELQQYGGVLPQKWPP